MWPYFRHGIWLFVALLVCHLIAYYHDVRDRLHGPTSRLEDRSSSAWCRGSHRSERTCTFRNLCFRSDTGDFVFFYGERTTALGHLDDDPALADLSSVSDHGALHFAFVDAPLAARTQFDIKDIDTDTVVMSRFNPDNLMHVFHDDLIPMFATAREVRGCYTDEEVSNCLDNMTFFFTDNRPKGQYWHLYQVLTQDQLLVPPSETPQLYCFNKATVGLQKQSTWYQYGFKNPQGPLEKNLKSAGKEIKLFAKHFLKMLDIQPSSSAESGYAIVVLRSKNRLILKAEELLDMVRTHTALMPVVVDLEKEALSKVIQLLVGAKLLVAMHGSALILSMFMKPGAVVLEMFPYGISPNQYTPYKTLANLPEMGLVYKSWRNTNLSNTVSHPEYEPSLGGILHLPVEQQDRIVQSSQVPPHLCCENPEWLFRIYQDTIVDSSIIPVLMEVRTTKVPEDKGLTEAMCPGPVIDIKCAIKELAQNQRLLHISWAKPWNVEFVGFRSCTYEVWLQSDSRVQTFQVESVEYRNLTIETGFRVWVKAMCDGNSGRFNVFPAYCKAAT
ncbi:unnamed protein product [Ixodes hexagonus]